MKNKVKNGISYEKNGWLYVSVKGKPKERGYANGYLCAKLFAQVKTMLNFYNCIQLMLFYLIDLIKNFFQIINIYYYIYLK